MIALLVFPGKSKQKDFKIFVFSGCVQVVFDVVYESITNASLRVSNRRE